MANRLYVYCPNCTGTYSAHPSDYFLSSPDTVFRCCRRLSWLCEARGRFEGDVIHARRVTVADLKAVA